MLARNTSSAISSSVAPFIFAAPVWNNWQYGHLMFAATARPISSRYFAGITVSSSWYFLKFGHSFTRASRGRAFMKPGTIPSVSRMSFNVSSYFPIHASPVRLRVGRFGAPKCGVEFKVLRGVAVRLPRVSPQELGEDVHRGGHVVPLQDEDRVRVARHGLDDVDPAGGERPREVR